MSSPGVVIKSQFVLSNNEFSTTHQKSFEEYIKYIERKEATDKQKNELKNLDTFSSYQDYMSNEVKTSSLFTKDEDILSNEGKKNLKKLFSLAQKNGSVMWQDVISFNNEWLEKHGIYDSKTNTLDEKKLKDVTRQSLEVMSEKEGLKDTSAWSAAIHYNTDNIHIHVAMVEPYPSPSRVIQQGPNKGQLRGKRKQKSIDAMKSKVVNSIMDRSNEYKKINDLIRNSIVSEKKNVALAELKKTKKLFKEIMNQLPDDKRQWQYNYNSIAHLRPKIDQLSSMFIEKFHKDDFMELQRQLQNETELMREAYGEGEEEKNRYEHFAENKINDLYTRLGNAVLKEMKEVAKEQEFQKRKRQPKKIRSPAFQKLKMGVRRRTSILKSLNEINRNMTFEYESWKNQRHFERFQEELEQEK
ncbi:MobP2 family relaxase [Bacillus sp. FSL M8-0168]|uniref:MobP2 family relaxase n=1 Tax=Bacillus sp. FSL M8-0168 TaxID=2921614 RepID=UPI0030FDA5F8